MLEKLEVLEVCNWYRMSELGNKFCMEGCRVGKFC